MLQESQIQEEEQYEETAAEEVVEPARARGSFVWVMSNISITKLLIRLDGN